MRGPFAERLLELLYPPKCVFCRRLLSAGEEHACTKCRASPPPGSGKLISGNEFFMGYVAPFYYGGSVRQALLRYKFTGHTAYADDFAEFIAGAVRRELDGCYDLISWTPISPRRKRERGYDQAELLARATARELGELAVPTLEKRRHTKTQSGISEPAVRRANVLGAYFVPEPSRVRGRRVLLIDDIVTTGSTLSECARTLLMAGAAEVWAAAAACGGGNAKD